MSSPSVAVIVNPAAWAAEAALHAVQRTAAARGIGLRVIVTTVAHPGRPQAAHEVDKGIRTVIAIGGDGTMRQVAAGLANSGAAFGVMPAGASNIFARNVGLRPVDHGRNAEIALSGHVRPADLGWVSLDDGPREPFLTMVGFGRDAEVVAAVAKRASHSNSWRAYVAEGLKTLRARPLPFTIEVPRPFEAWAAPAAPQGSSASPAARQGSSTTPERHWSVLVGNAPRVPLNARVFPGTRIDGGQLELLRVGSPSRLDWLGIAAFGLGLRKRAPKLRWTLVDEVSLSFPSPRAGQADGDVLPASTTASIGLDAGALLVCAPD